MIASQEKKLLSIDELDVKTRAELVRDVACSVFFGYYDERKGYTYEGITPIKDDIFTGIYDFLDNIEESFDFMVEYIDNFFHNNGNVYDDVRKCEVFYLSLNPQLNSSFNNLFNDFNYYLNDLGKRYNIILNDDFYNNLVKDILIEIEILFNKFVTEETWGDIYYQTVGLIERFMNMTMTMYNLKGLEKISVVRNTDTVTIIEYTDGEKSVRYRDNLL